MTSYTLDAVKGEPSAALERAGRQRALGTASLCASTSGTASTINSDGAPCDIIQAVRYLHRRRYHFTAIAICLRARHVSQLVHRAHHRELSVRRLFQKEPSTAYLRMYKLKDIANRLEISLRAI